jgi:hypothetical protein
VAHNNSVTDGSGSPEEGGDHQDSRLPPPAALPLPPSCNHPQCAHAHELLLLNRAVTSSAYVGIGSLWFPELLGLEALRPPPAMCLGADSCDSCRQLSQPPPSYTKLFLEDSPPSYLDAVTAGQEEAAGGGTCQEAASVVLCQEAGDIVACQEQLMTNTVSDRPAEDRQPSPKRSL